jgi:hypothetical protein
MPAFNTETGFLVLFVLLLGGLSVSNFVEASNSQATPYQRYFAVIYLLMAIGLIVYKINDR